MVYSIIFDLSSILGVVSLNDIKRTKIVILLILFFYYHYYYLLLKTKCFYFDNLFAEENGDEHLTEMNETSVEEPPKPPIKLRIIRRNDSDGFVSKVGSDATENDPGKIDTPPPPAPPSTFQPQIDLPIPPSAEQTESERVSSLPVLPAPNSPGTDQYAADQNELRDEVEPEPPSTKVLPLFQYYFISIIYTDMNCIGEGGKGRCC